LWIFVFLGEPGVCGFGQGDLAVCLWAQFVVMPNVTLKIPNPESAKITDVGGIRLQFFSSILSGKERCPA